MMENPWKRIVTGLRYNVLIRSLKNGCASLQDVFVGGNMFIYYSAKQARNRDFKGPDFFVVLGVDSSPEPQYIEHPTHSFNCI